MPGVLFLGPQPCLIDPNKQTVQSNTTITSTGSAGPYRGFGQKEINLLINLTGTPTGGTPTITFAIQELDPGNESTVLQTKTGTTLSAAGTQILTMPISFGGVFKVAWTVTGSTPSFGGVYVTLSAKNTGPLVGVDSSDVQRPVLLDTSGRLILGTGAQTVGKVDQGTGGVSAWKVDGSAVTQPISAASLPLPTSAAQEHVTAASPHAARLSDGSAFYDATKTGQLPSALVGGRVDANTGAWLGSTAPTVGQKAMASSVPVVVASDQSAVPISAASLPLPTNAAQDRTTAAAPTAARLSDGSAFYDAAKTGQLPSALVGGRLDENVGAWLGSTAPSVGQKAMASSLPMVIASDQTGIPTRLDPNQQTVQNNTNITASGSGGPYTGFGGNFIQLVINVTGTVTGTNPTLQFELQELDPIDQATVLQKRVGTVIIAGGAKQYVHLPCTRTACFKVVWTIGGTSTPTFNGCYVSLQAKGTEAIRSNPFGHVRTTQPSLLFEDVFSGVTVDTTDRWTTGVGGTGTVTQASGVLTLATGTTASNSAIIETKTTFHGGILKAVFEAKLEATFLSNNHRFWGWCTFGGGTSSNPVGEGVGFQITTGGVLQAVVYQGSSVLASSTIAAPPKDGAFHRYIIYWRSDQIHFCIDDEAAVVASFDYKFPTTKDITLRIQSYNGNPGPASGPTFQFETIEVYDAFGGNHTLSDPSFPWRQAGVTATGQLKTALYSAGGVDVPVEPATAILVAQRGIIAVANDGTNYRGLVVKTADPAAAETGLVVRPIPQNARILVGAYRAATSLITGNAGAQNLLSIHNPNASGKNVYVRRIVITSAAVAAATVKFAYRIGRVSGSLPSGGTTLTAQKHATADATAVGVVISGPTATAATGDLWTAAGGALTTVAGQYVSVPLIAFAEGNPEDDIVLAPNEALVVRADANDADLSHVVSVVWAEGSGAF